MASGVAGICCLLEIPFCLIEPIVRAVGHGLHLNEYFTVIYVNSG
jgi:hypothetical protein